MGLERLIEVAGPALSESTPRIPIECVTLAGAFEQQLLQLYWARNGFFAFESALHVFPISDSRDEIGLAQWNQSSAWRSSFGGLADGALFFAEDLFGGQFCIADGQIKRFDPETGDYTAIAQSIDDWAELVLSESQYQTGWPLAHEWQQRHGSLRLGKRLIPKVPFVLGGEYAVSNLHELDSTSAMRFYANIATQLRTLPDGTEVRLQIIE